MRTKQILAAFALLALLAALGSFTAATIQAAPAAQHTQPANNNAGNGYPDPGGLPWGDPQGLFGLFPGSPDTITGILVATPQSTLPTTLLLQAGGETVPVRVTTNTSIIDRAGDTLSLTALSDGDTLEVQGAGVGSGTFDATLVQDLSQTGTTTSTYKVTGTLAVAYSSVLCLEGANVVGSAITPSRAVTSPCASGELPVYLADSTGFEDQNGNATVLADLTTGDSLEVTGAFSDAAYTASLVQDLSQSFASSAAATTSYQVSIVGTVERVGATAQGSYFTMQVQQGSTAGVVTVYLQSNTQVLSSNGARARVSVLRPGQVATVLGMYNSSTHRLTTTYCVTVH